MKRFFISITLIFSLAMATNATTNENMNGYKKNSATHNTAYKYLIDSKESLLDIKRGFEERHKICTPTLVKDFSKMANLISLSSDMFTQVIRDIETNYPIAEGGDLSQIISRYKLATKSLESIQFKLNQINQNSSTYHTKMVYQEIKLQLEKVCSLVNIAKAKFYIYQKSNPKRITQN